MGFLSCTVSSFGFGEEHLVLFYSALPFHHALPIYPAVPAFIVGICGFFVQVGSTSHALSAMYLHLHNGFMF
jgi:hypothetical protein